MLISAVFIILICPTYKRNLIWKLKLLKKTTPMKLNLFATLMIVAFSSFSEGTTVEHHALDNFDDDAVLFG